MCRFLDRSRRVNRRISPIRTIIALVLVVIHPYLLGLTGRVAETIFQHELRVGMQRSDVVSLARRLGGNVDSPRWMDNLETGAPGKMNVTFIDLVTLCISGGRTYGLTFNGHWRLTSWGASRWGNAC
jgi:hypothetical protein